ncbi:MAG: hypothetical protein IJ728_06530 [Selenomonadaceae bacterium]|nr:hypothetical protein [Selenomonadaceae bacterium]
MLVEILAVMERIQDLQIEIIEMYTELSQLRERALQITQTLSDMPKSKNASSKIESAVLSYLTREQHILDKITQYEQAQEYFKNDVRKFITNKRMQSVLIFRYVFNMSWVKISKTLHTSLGQVNKDKRKAIKILEEEFEKMDTV